MKLIISFTTLLVIIFPKTIWAHALSPTYYPLGHIPILLIFDWWPFFILSPLALAVETFVLWKWFRPIGILGNLWRAALLYIVSKASETAIAFALDSIPLFRRAGWSSSFVENFGPLTLFLATGLFPAMLIGLLLYRRPYNKTSTVMRAVFTASLAGYLAALVLSLMLVMIRGYEVV